MNNITEVLHKFEGPCKAAVRDYISRDGDFPTNEKNVEIVAELISRLGQNAAVDERVVADAVRFCNERDLFV
ncbi:MAG TPA: hypothetical protein VLY23_04215 [Candidatus Acidoferrum sp.]|nr:hypothetical protein [Candidatus Acidoferrum sp.]